MVVTTPSTKIFLLGPSTSRVWISDLQAVASCFYEQLEWSCSYLHAEESIGSFCVAVPEEELGSRRDLEAE